MDYSERQPPGVVGIGADREGAARWGSSSAFHCLVRALVDQHDRDLLVASGCTLQAEGCDYSPEPRKALDTSESRHGQSKRPGIDEMVPLPSGMPVDIFEEEETSAGVQEPIERDADEDKRMKKGRPRFVSSRTMIKDKKMDLHVGGHHLKHDKTHDYDPRERCSIWNVAKSPWFDRCSVGLLVSNAVFIGVQVEYGFENSVPPAIEYIDYIFCVFFLLELMLRFTAHGCTFYWCDKEYRLWNIFDFIVVSLSTADTFSAIILRGVNSPLGNISILRIIRVVRVLRVLRIIRVLKFFQDLRILITSIVSTLKTASFAFILIASCIYMFAIAITQLVSDYLSSLQHAGGLAVNEEDMMFFFGSVGHTVFTLFMTISGGVDWKDAAIPLLETGFLAAFFYVLYVTLMTMCIMNVLTGIFCQAAVETAQNDRDNVMELQLKEKNMFIETLSELFESWGESGDGKCSLEEFTEHLGDKETEALLRTLEIDARDALALFELLDSNATGEINLDEFVTGCITLKGSAKAVHVEKVCNLSMRLAAKINDLDDTVHLMMKIVRSNQQALHDAKALHGSRPSAMPHAVAGKAAIVD
eukprot:TRINITY_DN82724_c0_g1_i1.p1 TRINITY_DN82724_c0_g1~~TRINITY_DN82724_c0_g1_i1.p1  ORF type:complete len:587 (+),score=100.57 TRINITY_DN82724_c0_g1_i1:11-1771(+)